MIPSADMKGKKQTNIEKVIDFTKHISDRTQDFTGREWVFKTINDWLAKSGGSHFFIFTGEPGSGKTAIASRLYQFSRGEVHPPYGLSYIQPGFLSAVHFCYARDRRWINPKIFAESLALQLAKRYPVFSEALVERSGDRNVHIEVDQKVNEAGQVIGVNINSIDLSGLSPEDAFIRIVREPLEALFHEESAKQVVILVDALDEALTYTGDVNIVGLLSRQENLPPQVRFILNSRPETEVLRPFKLDNAEELPLTEGEGLILSCNDVEKYIHKRLPDLVGQLSSNFSSGAFIDALKKKSKGNFLYVYYFLQMLLTQRKKIDRALIDKFPGELNKIYIQFLDRSIDNKKELWHKEYSPVIGTLAVAKEPLTEIQIANFVDMKRSHVRNVLNLLIQFLDVDSNLPATKRTYSIYHQSFAEFLLDENRSEEYWCEAQEQHERIIDYYIKNFKEKWSDCDDEYCFLYTVQHVIDVKSYDTLDDIITSDFMDACVQYFDWHMPFLENLERAVEVLPAEHVSKLCLRIIYGRKPNSLVNQRLLKLLTEKVRPELQKKGKKLGRPESKLDIMIDEAVAALDSPVEVSVHRLEALLTSVKNSRVRSIIALALGNTKSSLATPTLLSMLREEKGTVGWSAADALIALDNRSIIPKLIAYFEDASGSASLQTRLLYILGRMKANEARTLLSKGLEHPNLYVKARAIDLIWLLAPIENSEEILWQKLGFNPEGIEKDGNPAYKSEYLQHRLVTALGRVGSLKAKDHLRRFASDDVAYRMKPKTKHQMRRRHRLEESINRAIRDLEIRHIGNQFL